MKKFYLIVFFFFGLISVFSQTPITLTFMGKDSVTQNLISLDSVYVKNLTENCDTLLYGPVPVLSLIATWPVGIGEINANSSGAFILKQNYPNPFQGSTFVNIYREYRGALNLILFDELGTKLAEYHNEFEKGFHSFVISSSGNKVMILVVFDDKNNRSIKIISAGPGNESNTIQYLGHAPNVEKSNLKNPDNSDFIFYLGNQLMYTAYANGYYNNTKLDDPTTSTTYIFNMIPINTSFVCGDVVSYEGKTYNTVLIGTQCWFKENLNVGTRINGSQDQLDNGIKEKYCYNDLESNCDVYGGLYQWNEMMQYSTTPGIQGICPTEWHLATDEEWTTLTDYLGGENVAGGKMKEAGTAHWSSPNTGATNSSGFTALPGGSRNDLGNFVNLIDVANFWSSTETSSTNAWGRTLFSSGEFVGRYNFYIKILGFSARCVQD